jgi:hypothetical protein
LREGETVNIILSEPWQIETARLCTLRTALKLEIAGLAKRGRSAYSILKDMGYRGTRAAVLAAVQADIDRILKEGKQS